MLFVTVYSCCVHNCKTLSSHFRFLSVSMCFYGAERKLRFSTHKNVYEITKLEGCRGKTRLDLL